jgi:hypothetical protein
MRIPQLNGLLESSSQSEARPHAAPEAPSCTALTARSLLFCASAQQLRQLGNVRRDPLRLVSIAVSLCDVFLSACPAGHLGPSVRSREGRPQLLERLIRRARALIRRGVDELRHLSGKIDGGLGLDRALRTETT